MAAMKRTAGWTLAVLLALACAAPAAHAGRWDDRFLARDGQRQERFQREAPQRDRQERFQRRDEWSGRGGDRGGDDARQQRMSPEERRQLRRDVHDAGRDLYRQRR